MIDTFTVLRKELLEILGNRHSARGALIQAGVLVAIAGVLVPTTDASIWRNASAMSMLYLVFPATLAASVAADAFAGERERKTLETLLATPLPDRAIFLGKALAAVLFSSAVAAIALTAAALTAAGRRTATLPAAEHVLAILGGGLGSSAIAAAIATAMSMRVPVARSAQQMASVLSLLIAGGVAAALAALEVRLDWTTLPVLDAALGLAGALALTLAGSTFRRDRFFEER